MAKITIIMQGCDWTDASAEPLIMIVDLPLKTLQYWYNLWKNQVVFSREYIDKNTGNSVEYMSLDSWLVEFGFARKPEDDEVEYFWED